MTVVRLDVVSLSDNLDENGEQEVFRKDILYIDMNKVEKLLKEDATKEDHEKILFYSGKELREIQININHGSNRCLLEHDSLKYSLADTDSEYELVKADTENYQYHYRKNV